MSNDQEVVGEGDKESSRRESGRSCRRDRTPTRRGLGEERLLNLELVDFSYLIRVCIIAIGISYVITGSQIGFWVRAVWWLVTHRIPLISLDTLAFCPSCNAWWSGLVTAILTGSTWVTSLQCAFAACGLSAIVQIQFGLAAADEDKIRGIWRRDHGQAE